MIEAYETGIKHGASWRLFCSHGTVLFFIASHPGCTMREIAEALSLTQRTVWGLIGDLRRADLLLVTRRGRHHHYSVNPAGRFPDPIISHLTLGQALEAISCDSSPSREVAYVTEGPNAAQDASRCKFAVAAETSEAIPQWYGLLDRA